MAYEDEKSSLFVRNFNSVFNGFVACSNACSKSEFFIFQRVLESFGRNSTGAWKRKQRDRAVQNIFLQMAFVNEKRFAKIVVEGHFEFLSPFQGRT